MTNPTSNFGWQMPEPTDLVTDLPADFEVFGQAVDTDFVDLLGGTTGQVLSKTSNTDLDFTWVAATAGDITGVTAGTGISGGGTSGTVTVTNSMATAIDAKGDLVVGTGADTFSKLTVGSDTFLLTADSAEATGLKWAAAAGGGGSATYVGGTTFAAVSTFNVDNVFSATYQSYFAVMDSIGVTNTSNFINLKLRYSGSTTSGNGYYWGGYRSENSSAALTAANGSNTSSFRIGYPATYAGFVVLNFSNMYVAGNSGVSAAGVFENQFVFGGVYTVGAYIADGFNISTSDGSNLTGRIRVYGYNNS
jgi:hypothetical protein